MNLWLATNIVIRRDRALEASGIQNVRTAMALADLGHPTLLLAAEMEHGGYALLEERFGRRIPERLFILPCRSRGRKGEKRTPFSDPLSRLWNIARARLAAGAPDAILTRSPAVLAQLRGSRLISRRTRLVLEFQYLESHLLWRGWRSANPQ
ncbi:MAG: hypothetical protein NTW86_09320, partial [Candidatus Sumerlaeota bacterium]|nr:hypothetical protein [Candidatus Sumerlaeota bacterium]